MTQTLIDNDSRQRDIRHIVSDWPSETIGKVRIGPTTRLRQTDSLCQLLKPKDLELNTV